MSVETFAVVFVYPEGRYVRKYETAASREESIVRHLQTWEPREVILVDLIERRKVAA